MKTLNVIMAVVSGLLSLCCLAGEPSTAGSIAFFLWLIMMIVFILNYKEIKFLKKQVKKLKKEAK